jgi:hypothetical protein
MTRYFPCLLLLLLLMGRCIAGDAQEANLSQGSDYYPLAKGNRWVYRVRTAGRANSSKVEWRVTSEERSKEGKVYQVWPTPMNSDDEAMVLRVTPAGIEETTSGVLIVRSHPVSGDTWTSGEASWSAARKLRVLSVHELCRAGPVTSDDCMRVQDQNEHLHSRTVTTYVRGIGPVRYEYFQGGSLGTAPKQTVELIAYELSSK